MPTLTIGFEGYWQCRQATDPDPSWDPRGASGYTFAVGEENDLDQIVRLQKDEIDARDFRVVAGEPSSTRFGVHVTDVACDGDRWSEGEALKRGKVRWLPAGEPGSGPRFEMRNTVIYHPVKDGIFMPIVPFHIQVASPDGTILLSRDDPLDPVHPELEVWQIADAEVYRRRCPRRFVHQSDEVVEAIGLDAGNAPAAFDAYFERREQYLQLAISELESRHAAKQIDETTFQVRARGLQLRLFALRFSDSFEDRLGLQAEWDHDLVGPSIDVRGEEKLGGTVARDQPWHVRFWMGGFDGDLHRGYIRGTLSVPFTPGRGTA